jgi:hypothetical protein
MGRTKDLCQRDARDTAATFTDLPAFVVVALTAVARRHAAKIKFLAIL